MNLSPEEAGAAAADKALADLGILPLPDKSQESSKKVDTGVDAPDFDR